LIICILFLSSGVRLLRRDKATFGVLEDGLLRKAERLKVVDCFVPIVVIYIFGGPANIEMLLPLGTKVLGVYGDEMDLAI